MVIPPCCYQIQIEREKEVFVTRAGVANEARSAKKIDTV